MPFILEMASQRPSPLFIGSSYILSYSQGVTRTVALDSIRDRVPDRCIVHIEEDILDDLGRYIGMIPPGRIGNALVKLSNYQNICIDTLDRIEDRLPSALGGICFSCA